MLLSGRKTFWWQKFNAFQCRVIVSNVVYYSKPCCFTYITALCHLFTNDVSSIDTYNCTSLNKYAFFRLFYILLCMIAHLMCNIRHWSGCHYQALLDVRKFHDTFLMKVCFIISPPPPPPPPSLKICINSVCNLLSNLTTFTSACVPWGGGNW